MATYGSATDGVLMDESPPWLHDRVDLGIQASTNNHGGGVYTVAGTVTGLDGIATLDE